MRVEAVCFAEQEAYTAVTSLITLFFWKLLEVHVLIGCGTLKLAGFDIV